MSFCFRRTDGTIYHDPATCECGKPWTPPPGWWGNSNDGRIWAWTPASEGER